MKTLIVTGNSTQTANRRRKSSRLDAVQSSLRQYLNPENAKGKRHNNTWFSTRGKGSRPRSNKYDPTSIINALRSHVDQWRGIPNSNNWQVTPETARLLQYWRYHSFSGIRPFFCQIEVVETAIWLTEVAPNDKAGKGFLEHLANASNDANPDLVRLALKLATGAGKTTVMAMLIEVRV